MNDNWDDDVEAKIQFAQRSNKWEGEDEEEDVKDSWDAVLDEEEEKKDEGKEAKEAPKPKQKPKKKVNEKIEERERKDREEAERKAREKEEAMTPEERRAEQLRRQKMAEEADLRLAMETFGVEAIDTMQPDTKEEFDKFADALLVKMNQFNKHTEFPRFAEDLITRLAVNLSSISLKKLKTTIDNLAIEKAKLEKGDKGKKNKGKGKAKLRMEGDNAHLSEYGYDTFDNEYDDFM